MKIGIIGSGIVAQTIANKLLEIGHEVMISSRSLEKSKDSLPSPSDWASLHL